jgi:hypothetical protein
MGGDKWMLMLVLTGLSELCWLLGLHFQARMGGWIKVRPSYPIGRHRLLLSELKRPLG